ncbi:MAG: type II secretion system F family protein [Planctomycetota bacterium]
MPVFQYSGIDRARSKTNGTIIADSARHARDQLREQGVVVHAVQQVSEIRANLRSMLASSTIKHRQAASQWGLVAHELSMLLAAGIPLVDSLDALAGQHRGGTKTCIMMLRDRVEAGVSLADAMSEQPKVFDEASQRLVEVGEKAGTLESVLAEIAEFRLQMGEFKDRVTTALLYPAFLACFALAAMLFLMTWVLPPLLESLQETLPTLPWPTRVAKGLSDLLVRYGLWLAIGGVASGAIVFALLRTERGRMIVDEQVLRLPLLGPLLLKQSIARIAMIIGLLSRSGVMLTVAVRLAASSTSNRVIKNALFDIERQMEAGENIADSMQRSKVFPPLMVRFFAVGQDSGKLEEMLQRLAMDYNKQIATSTARMTAFVEPILILILAVGVGFLLLATILPILEAGNVSSI